MFLQPTISVFLLSLKSQIHGHEVRRLLKKDLLIPKQRVEWCVVLELKQGHPDLSQQVLVINRPLSRQQLWLCRYGIVGTGKLARKLRAMGVAKKSQYKL